MSGPKSIKTVRVKKQLIGRDDRSPEGAPVFVNHFQVSRAESDWYLDVGLIPIDQILEIEARETMDFLVLERLAMSLPTIKNLRDQISSVIEKAEEQGTTDGQLEPKGTPRKGRSKAKKSRRT